MGNKGHAPKLNTVDDNSSSGFSYTVLKDAGYAIAQKEGDWLLFDAGPIAAGLHSDATPSAAHGHADTLQVLYWL